MEGLRSISVQTTVTSGSDRRHAVLSFRQGRNAPGIVCTGPETVENSRRGAALRRADEGVCPHVACGGPWWHAKSEIDLKGFGGRSHLVTRCTPLVGRGTSPQYTKIGRTGEPGACPHAVRCRCALRAIAGRMPALPSCGAALRRADEGVCPHVAFGGMHGGNRG
jgi:hypothetical protein